MPIEQLGPYRVQRVLGHGGMGTVYAGAHRQTGEQAAIKVLSDALAADPRFRERFQGEVETLKKLRHKNIVALHGYGEEEGRLFFVMELVHGQSLELDLRIGRRFTWNESADIGVQVCAALKHAHDHGVIHRDLKPANLLMTANGTVKLTDFGIAKFFGSTGLTVAGSMIGTPDYMSPEQTEGKPVTPRSDLFSLGCVLYALLTGKPPFSGGSVTQVIDRVRFQDPVAVRLIAPGVPDEFDRIICQLLRKDPADRIATPQLLANLLQAMRHALSDRSASTRPPDKPTPTANDTTVVRSPENGSDESSSTRLATSERPTVDFTPSQQRRFEQHEPADVDRTDPSFHEAGRTRELVVKPAGPGKVADESKNRFTTVSDEDWRKSIETPEVAHGRRSDRLIVVVMVLGLAAIVAAFVVAFLPPSADRLHNQIQTLSRMETPPEKYVKCMKEFLDRYPDDPRAGGVQALLDDYQCRQLRDGLLNKIRSLTAEEKLFVEGMKLADEGRLPEARHRFRQIVESLQGHSLTVTENRLLGRAQHMLKKAKQSERPGGGAPNS